MTPPAAGGGIGADRTAPIPAERFS